MASFLLFFLLGPGAAPVPEIPLEELFVVPWGSGGALLSRDDGRESIPQGPMSFAVEPDGSIWVLDAIARRLVRYGAGGELLSELALPASTFEDLELRGGRLYVLDRLVRRSVLVLDAQGPILEVPVEGPGISEGGGISAMLAEEDGLWLEYEHQELVRVLDADAREGDRTVVAGRPVPGSSHRLRAWLDRGGRPRAWLELWPAAGGAPRASRSVPLDGPTPRIAWIQAGPGGLIAAIFHVVRAAAPGATPTEENLGLWLGPDLRILATFRSPYCLRAWQQQREFRLAPDGALIGMALTSEGVRFLRWRHP